MGVWEGVATTLLGRWDQRFQSLACHVSEWSKDPSTKCGAVIVDQNRRVVSLGYNGFPKLIKDDPALYLDKGHKYQRIIHADENAVLFAATPIEGCTIYTWPFMPCAKCASILVQKGIARVVAPDSAPANWLKSVELAKDTFHQAGVKLVLTRARL